MKGNMAYKGDVTVLSTVLTKLRQGNLMLFYSKMLETRNGIEFLDEAEKTFVPQIDRISCSFNATSEFFYITVHTEKELIYQNIRKFWETYRDHAESVRMSKEVDAIEDHCMRVTLGLIDETEKMGYSIIALNPVIVARDGGDIVLVFKAEFVTYSADTVDLVEYLSELEYEQAEEVNGQTEEAYDENDQIVSNDDLLNVD